LRLIIGRALGTLDLPPYPSLDSLAEALSRFAAIDPVECFQHIVSSRPGAAEVPSLPDAPEPALTITVSDIRRARRAAGVPLAEISRRCDVPPHLLRQLEWGYLLNWPTSHVGRRLIAAYARAAGLDEQLVIGVVWPLLMESGLRRSAMPAPAVAAPRADIVIEPAMVADVPSGTLVRIARVAPRAPSTMRRVVAALTIPALLAIGAAPALWHAGAHHDGRVQATAPPPHVAAAPMPEAQPPVRDPSVMIATAPVRADAPVSAVIVRQSLSRAQPPAPVKVKRSASPAPKAAHAPQKATRRGPRKWGSWVLNKMGVKVVSNTEQQNP